MANAVRALTTSPVAAACGCPPAALTMPARGLSGEIHMTSSATDAGLDLLIDAIARRLAARAERPAAHTDAAMLLTQLDSLFIEVDALRPHRDRLRTALG